jgi:hypothetical protein
MMNFWSFWLGFGVLVGAVPLVFTWVGSPLPTVWAPPLFDSEGNFIVIGIFGFYYRL